MRRHALTPTSLWRRSLRLNPRHGLKRSLNQSRNQKNEPELSRRTTSLSRGASAEVTTILSRGASAEVTTNLSRAVGRGQRLRQRKGPPETDRPWTKPQDAKSKNLKRAKQSDSKPNSVRQKKREEDGEPTER